MGSDRFSLRWNNYQAHLVTAFESLLEKNEFVDVTLGCDGRKLSAHRMLLSACSPYFRNLLQDNHCQHPIILLRDITYSDMSSLLQFMYNGELRLAVAVKKVLSAAQLSGNNLYMELSLLQPNWLSSLVSQESIKKEEKPVISLKEITEKFSQLKLSNDSILTASMDNLVHRMCGFLHCHTIFRIIWHHSKKGQGDLDTFRYMNKLLSRGHKSTEKIIKFKSDVQVSISDLVADMNTLREFVNEGMKEEVPGALSALLFRMTTVTQF